MIGIQYSNRKLPFFCGMENAKACASAALRDGEKSLKCIGFLDGKGAIRQVVKNQAFAIVKCIKWKVFGLKQNFRCMDFSKSVKFAA